MKPSLITPAQIGSLPRPASLERCVRAAAVVEVFLKADARVRVFGTAPWIEGARLSRMCDFQGDQFDIVFAACGTLVLGVDGECPADDEFLDTLRDEVLGAKSQVPAGLRRFCARPELEVYESMLTYAVWYTSGSARWVVPRVLLSDAEMANYPLVGLEMVSDPPRSVVRWIELEYERSVPPWVIDRLVTQGTVDAEIGVLLGSTRRFEDARAELERLQLC